MQCDAQSWIFQSALAVAIVNIQIPILLGDVVNVVSKYTSESAGNFTEDIRKPGLKILQMFCIQVRMMMMFDSNLYRCTVERYTHITRSCDSFLHPGRADLHLYLTAVYCGGEGVHQSPKNPLQLHHCARYCLLRCAQDWWNCQQVCVCNQQFYQELSWQNSTIIKLLTLKRHLLYFLSTGWQLMSKISRALSSCVFLRDYAVSPRW